MHAELARVLYWLGTTGVTSALPAQEYADELGIPFLETSAKSRPHLDRFFCVLARANRGLAVRLQMLPTWRRRL